MCHLLTVCSAYFEGLTNMGFFGPMLIPILGSEKILIFDVLGVGGQKSTGGVLE